MGTTNLKFHHPLGTQLRLRPEETTQNIYAPAGESAFYLLQPTNDSTAYTLHFHLTEPDSQVLIKGLVIAHKSEVPNLTTVVHHHASRTRAETLIRTLAYESSQPHYQGLIDIDKDIVDIESYLNHHSLLLGKEAKSWTLPSLEIRANQVKCSHAATIRSIKESDLFYARSRGLSLEEAKKIMIEAFVSDVKECLH